jgi:hypothetical protein
LNYFSPAEGDIEVTILVFTETIAVLCPALEYSIQLRLSFFNRPSENISLEMYKLCQFGINFIPFVHKHREFQKPLKKQILFVKVLYLLLRKYVKDQIAGVTCTSIVSYFVTELISSR